MINDILIEAIDMMINMCADERQASGMNLLKEFVCDFCEDDWLNFSMEEKREFIAKIFANE